MTMWSGYWFCLASKTLLTSTESEFESHFVGLKDSLSTGFFGPGSGNVHGRPMSSYGATTSGERSEFEGELSFAYPQPIPR